MKNARLHNKTTRSRPDRGQNLEAEAKASRLQPRPRPKFWPEATFASVTKHNTFCRTPHSLRMLGTYLYKWDEG